MRNCQLLTFDAGWVEGISQGPAARREPSPDWVKSLLRTFKATVETDPGRVEAPFEQTGRGLVGHVVLVECCNLSAGPAVGPRTR